jgi:dienelactone hydrolase
VDKLSIARVLKGLLIAGAAGIVVLFGSLAIENRAETSLPTPTGPFSVGRTTLDWLDDAPNSKRELLAWIWYPSEPSARKEAYIPAPLRTEVDRDRGVLDGKFLTRDLSKVHAHSFSNPDVSRQQQSYPVVIMRGGASLEVWNYSTLAEDLASHGYIVLGFDTPYRTGIVMFPDGRVMRRLPENNAELCEEEPLAEQSACVSKLLAAWSSDTAFALDRLTQINSNPSGKFSGRLDMTHVGVFGHSFGGATALTFCHDDPRCKAGIDIDGKPFGSVIQDGLHQPFLFILSDQIHGTDAETRQVVAEIQSIYDHLPPDGRQRIMIRGANHFLFSDDGALLKSHIVMGTLRTVGLVGIDGRRQLAVTAHSVHTFFDVYLKGTTAPPPVLASPGYPEIQLLN